MFQGQQIIEPGANVKGGNSMEKKNGKVNNCMGDVMEQAGRIEADMAEERPVVRYSRRTGHAYRIKMEGRVIYVEF